MYCMTILFLLFDHYDLILYIFCKKNKKQISLGPWSNPVECILFLLNLTYHWYIISAHWTEARKKNEHHFPECIHVCTSLVNFLGFLVHHLSHTYKNAD